MKTLKGGWNNKKVLIILSLVFTFSIVGGLYNTLAQLNKLETVSEEGVYGDQCPDQMPDVVLDPMVGFPLY